MSPTVYTPPQTAPPSPSEGPLSPPDTDDPANHPIPPTLYIPIKPLTITLDAWGLSLLSISLVLGIHLIERPVLSAVILLTPIALLIRTDYHNFLALGPGSTPSTPAGYLYLSILRFFALSDPFHPPRFWPNLAQKPAHGILSPIDSSTLGKHPKLKGLPYRTGPRPPTAGLAPQRQLTQHSPAHITHLLRQTLLHLSSQHPALLTTARSSLELNGLALFAKNPVNVCGNGEILHVHAIDRSMHMNLHPEDIEEVLGKGWGERHPLAWEEGRDKCGGWVRSPVPGTFVMVYAPRDENDLLAVCKIIEAAIWWTAAEKIEVLPPSSSPSPSTTFSDDVVNGAGNGDELEAEEDERKVSKCCAGCQA